MVSPRFALARNFSGLPFLAAADSFPTLVLCCGEGNDGKGFSLGVGMCTSVRVSTCKREQTTAVVGDG